MAELLCFYSVSIADTSYNLLTVKDIFQEVLCVFGS